MVDQGARSRSAKLYERALQVLPGGVSRNTVLRKPHPVYVADASGCRVTDVDGTERIDFSNNMASLIHGHAQPDVVAAVTEQLHKGSAYTLATEIEIRFAEHLRNRNPSFQKLRFVNSGTEAIMAGLKAARAFTGRAKIAKVEGAYHGGYDYAEVSQTATPANWGDDDRPASVPVAHGTPPNALADVVIIPFNDVERALAILDEHRGELAAVLLDLMPHRVGLVPADKVFVSALREWTRKDGSLLVLDEVVSFRSEYGGAQVWYDITPDLTAMGKAIGGGFPIGAIAGRADLMDIMNPHGPSFLFPHSGTFSANPITLTAGLVAMEQFDEPAIARLNALAKRAMTDIQRVIDEVGYPACVSGGGSLLRVHMKDKVPRNYREAYTTPEETNRLRFLIDHLFQEGLIMINTCTAALSTALGDAEIDRLVEGVRSGLSRLRSNS